ncbi:caspase family protein [Vibrio sp. 1151_11]|nr:caspase family protein [Vibrio sp. 1151_11]
MNRKMTALIVGNGDYQNGNTKLKNAVNDANDIAEVLEKLGFSTIKHVDCTIEELDRAISSFRDGLNSNDVGLFYFAGHGIQIDGENYITAINSSFIDESAVRYTSYPLNRLIETMDSCSNKTNLIILDACRDNPCESAWTRSASAKSLAPMFAPKGTLIAYSTSPGETASDGAGNNGAYTESLLKHITKPDIPIEDVFKKVRNTLSVITKGTQTSWEHTSLTGEYYFNLSLGNKINKYNKFSISDNLFTLDKSNQIHTTISDLKSYDWYVQNPAVNKLNASIINISDADSLFVLGRNLYQAACGGSRSAVSYVDDFRNKLVGVGIDKQCSILEGMLFEVFFNSKGEFRESFKVAMFNDLFALDVYPDYKPAFEFISELLLPFNQHFYVIPGKPTGDIAIELATTQGVDDSIVITDVYFDGDSILEGEDGWEDYSFDGKVIYDSMRYDSFLDKISKEMMIPEKYISLQSNITIDTASKLKVPYRHTLKRS